MYVIAVNKSRKFLLNVRQLLILFWTTSYTNLDRVMSNRLWRVSLKYFFVHSADVNEFADKQTDGHNNAADNLSAICLQLLQPTEA